MYDALKINGKLVTYAARGVVKVWLKLGFVEKLEGLRKREMFRAEILTICFMFYFFSKKNFRVEIIMKIVRYLDRLLF
jgi:hypothetical protein